MNIYLVEAPEDFMGYDTYDSFVCKADSPEEARKTSPSEYYKLVDNNWHFVYYDGTSRENNNRDDWPGPLDLHRLNITEIGKANTNEPGVVLASFNAG